MKRLTILTSILFIAIGIQAQANRHSNYIGLNLGAGANTLMYSPAQGSWSLSWGPLAELRYSHFFGKHFGIGIGGAFSIAQAKASYDFTETSTGMTHVDNANATYDLLTVFDHWSEKQSVGIVSVPVELYWRALLGDKWNFIFGLGAQFDLPVGGRYTADDGTYSTQGYFPALGYAVSNLPNHGFQSYDADFESDIELNRPAVSLIADLGFNRSLGKHWGLYLGLYGGFGLTSLLDSTSTKPLLNINEANASQLDYNGTFASNQIDALRLLYAGVKIGLNIGWNCHAEPTASEEPEVVAYDPTPQEKTPAETAKPANNTQGQYGNNVADDGGAAEAAAREARCNARRMNNPDMAQALAHIDTDLDEAAQTIADASDPTANSALADARAKANDAKRAHQSGKYCRAYDLFHDAYARMADSYAAAAQPYSRETNTDAAAKAAQDAALYAEASHNDGLDCAMAASRNAKLTCDLARKSNNATTTAAYTEPAHAERMAQAALNMAEASGSKTGRTDAKDASGKAYRGNVADSYAASAKSFAGSAATCAANGDAAAKAAAVEAQRHAAEGADAARIGNIGAAYQAALAAQQAAHRACNGGATTKPSGSSQPTAKPTSGTRAQVQKHLDQIGATVHYDFGSTEPTLNAREQAAVKAVAAAMKADSSLRLLITGHTDNVGTAEGNMAIGMQRANALKRILVSEGAPASHIKTASKGQAEPVADNDTDEHRHQNRRAVISLR